MQLPRGASALTLVFSSFLFSACVAPKPEVGEGASPFTGTWQQELSATNLATQDRLGSSVAIDGELLISGLPFAGGSANTGSVVAYRRQNDGSFAEEAVLTSSTPVNNGYFGGAVALDGNTALVGAYGEGTSSTGAAHVMVRDPNTGLWSEQAQLVPSDGDADDYFGFEVALDGDIAAVGAINYEVQSGTSNVGAVYVFVRSGTTWTQAAIISPPTNANFQYFGRALALEGNRIVVGAPKGAGANLPGRAHIYETPNGGQTWGFQATLVASVTASGDQFGREVALSGDTVVVNSEANDGWAVVFEHVNGTWSEQEAIAGTAESGFARALALDADVLAIGAPLRDVPASNVGALYLYRRSGSTWTQEGDLVPSGLSVNANMGTSVALAAHTLAVGAPLQATQVTGGGAVFVAQVGGELGEACSDAAGCLSGFCVDGLCCDTACDDGCGTCGLSGSEGTCSPEPSGTTCREAAGACDAAEVCDGSALGCPADEVAPDGSVCDGGVCDGGMCVDDGAGGGSTSVSSSTSSGASTSGAGGGDGVPPVEEEGGCSASGHAQGGPVSLWLGVLAALGLSRRRR